MSEYSRVVPLVHLGMLLVDNADGCDLEVFHNSSLVGEISSPNGNIFILNAEAAGVNRIDIKGRATRTSVVGSPFSYRKGNWSGTVTSRRGNLVLGFAADMLDATRDVVVVASNETNVVAFATAKAIDNGRFVLVLPDALQGTEDKIVKIGIVGSDFVLDRGVFILTKQLAQSKVTLRAVSSAPMTIAIKISTPNLRVAEQWGDYHFANSLKASFEKLGIAARVDTNDVWYQSGAKPDAVIVLRGRHGFKPDPECINLLWLISHPDRIEDSEYAAFDHIFVASDIYTKALKEKHLPSVSVLHQATDQRYFHPMEGVERAPTCLFVGNSRSEYRTMVKWCVEKNLSLELYGGGWAGVVSPDMVRAQIIPNSELSTHYASNMILLNDHWDSMRDNGFPSNRLFDGSAVGTPIITDAISGLADVFGDAITVVNSADELEIVVSDCLADPKPYLDRAARAGAIVMQHHTFDHRAEEIRQYIEKSVKFLVQRKGGCR